MISAQRQRDWFRKQSQAANDARPGQEPVWLRQLRQEAYAGLSELPLLTRKQEAWRYTSIDGLLAQRFRRPDDPPDTAGTLHFDHLLLPERESYRLVFFNGRCVPQLSCLGELPEGVRLDSLRSTLDNDPDFLSGRSGSIAGHSGHLFAALNGALFDDGLVLHVGPGIELGRPVEVLYYGTAKPEAVTMQLRNLVVLEQDSRATLIERFAGSEGALYFHNNLSEISVGEGASLHHYRVQDESRTAWHLSSLYLAQQGGSDYRSTGLSLGGVWSRTEYKVGLGCQHARCELNGLYTVGDGQLADFHLNVKHDVPSCTSRENFRGILYGKGRAVFDGHVLVGPRAQHSDARLSNDNLLLSRNAEIDTKPQLEIYADDVKCSHGTTVGQLDPEEVFYMRSRGIDAASARRMLSMGFAGSVLESINIEGLREQLADRLADTISEAIPDDGEA